MLGNAEKARKWAALVPATKAGDGAAYNWGVAEVELLSRELK
jgi:hypothetical protein